MSTKNLIPVTTFCKRHNIELSFINSLKEYGLIEIVRTEQQIFIYEEELPRLEQIVLFNKELEINLEGVEVIMRLLERVNMIQEEMNVLRNRLGFYESLRDVYIKTTSH